MYGDGSWKDLLTSYNGYSITSDAIGNMLRSDTKTYTWQHGRQLSFVGMGNNRGATFTYDAEGKRIGLRAAGYGVYSYYYAGDKLTDMSIGSKKLHFVYDNLGVESVDYNGTVYYYLKNAQGDVTGLTDTTGNLVVEYTYDAWGNILSTTGSLANTLGVHNPFRYRGYIYDECTKLYYLQTRYYDPAIGRFVCADSAIGQVGQARGHNLFVYGFNNPVMYEDETGNWPKLSKIFTVVAIAAATVMVAAAIVATCGAAIPALAATGAGIISVGAATSAVSIATGAMVVAGVSAAAAVTSAAVERATERKSKRNNNVYVLKDDNGTVQYVGRTNNVERRSRAHNTNPVRAGLDMQVIASGLSLQEARALEQAGMAYYHTINTLDKMNNQINSISPKYWDVFKELALGILDYGWNQMTNEILYWTGN